MFGGHELHEHGSTTCSAMNRPRRAPAPPRYGAAVCRPRRSRHPHQPGDTPVSTRRDGLSRTHILAYNPFFTVPHCLRWQADTRYLRFEGLISRSRNIYLRFKGLPKRDIRSMRGHPALESCGFRPGSTRAPTPRNADRCPNEPEAPPRNAIRLQHPARLLIPRCIARSGCVPRPGR